MCFPSRHSHAAQAGRSERASSQGARKAAPSLGRSSQYGRDQQDRAQHLLAAYEHRRLRFMAFVDAQPQVSALKRARRTRIRSACAAWRSGLKAARSKPSRQLGGGAVAGAQDSRAPAPTSSQHGAGVIEAAEGFRPDRAAALLGSNLPANSTNRRGWSCPSLWRQGLRLTPRGRGSGLKTLIVHVVGPATIRRLECRRRGGKPRWPGPRQGRP